MDVDSRGLEKLGKAKGGERYKKKPTGTKVGPVAPTNKELGLGKKRATRSLEYDKIRCHRNQSRFLTTIKRAYQRGGVHET